jgi:hypothetical protein
MPYNPSRHADWFRLVRFRSPLLTESLRFLFHGLVRCFSSPGALLTPYGFRCGCRSITLDGFPHSEILGSSLLCSSPRRIAAYASFFGNLSLGIRRAPSVAFYIRVLLGAFNAHSTHHYATVKMLWPLGHRIGQDAHRQRRIIPKNPFQVKLPSRFSENRDHWLRSVPL